MDRDESLYFIKLAEKGKQYDEMIENIKTVIKVSVSLGITIKQSNHPRFQFCRQTVDSTLKKGSSSTNPTRQPLDQCAMR